MLLIVLNGRPQSKLIIKLASKFKFAQAINRLVVPQLKHNHLFGLHMTHTVLL